MMKLGFSDRFPSCVYYLVVRNWRSPDSLFGKVDRRKNYSFDEAQQKFLEVWQSGLDEAVKQAPECSYETAKEQISENEQCFLKRDAIYRTVNYRSLLFVAQLFPKDQDDIELDQLWFVHSHDKDNIILCVEFKTQEDKDQFHRLAKRLGFQDGRVLLQSYVDNLLKENNMV